MFLAILGSCLAVLAVMRILSAGLSSAGQGGSEARLGARSGVRLVLQPPRFFSAEVRAPAVRPLRASRPDGRSCWKKRAACARVAPMRKESLNFLKSLLDTVSVTGMTIDPFSGEIRDGKLFGRGATDTKGPMAAMLHACLFVHVIHPWFHPQAACG